MSGPLSASATTMGALFSGSTFEIPAFQREYAWEKDQVTDFWNDLSSGLEDGTYFLGLIVLTGNQDSKQVVDGQQRILTVSLLAAALRQKALSIGRAALADRIKSTFLRTVDFDTDAIIPRVRLADTATDADFQEILDNGALSRGGASLQGSTRNLWWAYKFFIEKLDQVQADSAFKQLGTWTEFISDKLYLADFEHSDEGSAYSVFEVINTRGKQLTTADLLKNFVLRETPVSNRQRVYERWTKMVAQFQKVGTQNFVQYIRHVVILKSGYILPKDLYNYIAKRGSYASGPNFSVEELMDLLEAELPLYLQLIDPTLDGPADNAALGIFVAFNDIGISAVRPLILALSGTDNSLESMTQVLKLVVRKLVVGNLGASSVEKKFADCARLVWGSGELGNSLDGLNDLDAPREEFIDQLARHSYNRSVLTFLRRSIVQRTTTPNPEGTLQFVRPRQSAFDSWPGYSDEQATYWFSTIGNTLLVNVDRRPKSANTWAGVKENLLVRAVRGEINDELAAEDAWTPDVIESFGVRLANEAANVWY